MKWKRSSLYRYCMCLSSKSTSSTFSPARNVLSMTRPCLMCLSLVRTKAPPLPGLTCWKSTMVYGCPSNWIFNPFLNSAVDTCMTLWPLPFLGLGPQRLFETVAGPGIARILPCEAQEDLRRFVVEPLLEAEGAHAHRCECIVRQYAPQRRPVARAPFRGKRLEQQARFPIARVELDHALQMLPCLLEPPGPAVHVRGQAMRLGVLRARLQYDAQLREGSLGIAVVQVRLGQDETRRRVVRKASEPLAAEVDGFPRPSGLAIGIGQGSERERGRIAGQPLLVPSDGARRHGILGGGPPGLRDRVRHG